MFMISRCPEETFKIVISWLYLEQIPAEVDWVRDLQGDPGSFIFDAACRLDLVGFKPTKVAHGRYEYHLLEVGDTCKNRKF